MTKQSIIFDTDSYKTSHSMLYPKGTSSVFSYIESRGGLYHETVFFGLQYLLKEYLEGCVVTVDDVNEATEFYAAHGVPFDSAGWMYIATKLSGKLPVRIRAVREGSVIPVSLPLVTIESTDSNVPWITSWLETMLMRVWYPINVATLGYHIKQDLIGWQAKTSDLGNDALSFKLHDFGARGVSSQESAALGGAAHLVNFLGSDTIAGIRAANKHYKTPMAGFSIPASEHSTITSWGRAGELDAYRNMLNTYGKPGALFACVSDSYDLFHAVDQLWGTELRQQVIDSGATLVIRPDSGSPPIIVTETIRRLDAKFGHTVNSKGYKVLNNVRVIQGDGINHKMINEIMRAITLCGYSLDNLAFGMGGALLQQHDRDTQKFAMKCSSITVDGVERDVYKDPITDSGKKSKKGRLDLIIDEDHQAGNIYESYRFYAAERIQSGEISIPHRKSELHVVFDNGQLYNETTMDSVRELVALGVKPYDD